MRFSFASITVVALAAQGTVASNWFGNPGKPVYNKWHETELDRWLTDHNVPHPKAADRKELENLVKEHWNDKVVQPYHSWDAKTLQNYLTLKGYQAKEGAEKNKQSLVEQVKQYWTETEESANQAYSNVRDWIFDTWTESQLKAFADRHGIPVPQPRKRDTLLRSVRENYQTVANKVSQTAHYPGDWLYETWSDSDLKAWLDERGIPVPQPSSRDKLVASVRRNARIASLNAQAAYAAASKSAANAQQSLSDALLDSWSDSQIKEWADKNGIKVPQGSKRNELLALARKHRARLYGDNISATVTSAYGAATSKAGNQYAQATEGFHGYTNWIKAKLGMATDYAQASASSASAAASKSAHSASASLSKSASSASAAASKSAKKGYDAAAESAKKATDRAKEEL
ncbi:uncharacterized protein EI97DRAFT_470909 [Westerdykella ornata]|uniref:Stress response protein ish1 n=1 Tax=Westerdykella ornata TaxID=318751 RepID=A0A6A6J5F2_WESOR|nr:uncharacterized protein EI97DRAFT_470909 [Westerdykella ornata]KAF2271820.1 hypothetical protein EI97DRAFT_470909 [Westerdykella ornata]